MSCYEDFSLASVAGKVCVLTSSSEDGSAVRVIINYGRISGGNDYFKRGADAAGLAHAKEAFTRAAEGGLRPSQVSTITTLGGNYWHAFNSQQYLIFDMHLDSQAANVYAKHDMLAFYEPRINYFADEYCKGLKYIHININHKN